MTDIDYTEANTEWGDHRVTLQRIPIGFCFCARFQKHVSKIKFKKHAFALYYLQVNVFNIYIPSSDKSRI